MSIGRAPKITDPETFDYSVFDEPLRKRHQQQQVKKTLWVTCAISLIIAGMFYHEWLSSLVYSIRVALSNFIAP